MRGRCGPTVIPRATTTVRRASLTGRRSRGSCSRDADRADPHHRTRISRLTPTRSSTRRPTRKPDENGPTDEQTAAQALPASGIVALSYSVPGGVGPAPRIRHIKAPKAFVTNDSRKTVKGKVQRVTNSTLVLRTGQDDLTIEAPDIECIARRGHTVGMARSSGSRRGLPSVPRWRRLRIRAPIPAFRVLVACSRSAGSSARPAAGRFQAVITPSLQRRGGAIHLQVAW